MALPEKDDITEYPHELSARDPQTQLVHLDEVLLERDYSTLENPSSDFPERILVDLHPRKRLREERELEEEIHKKRYDAGLTRFPTLKEELDFKAICEPESAFPRPFETRQTIEGDQAIFLNIDTKSFDADYIKHHFQLVCFLIHEYHRKHPLSVSKTLLQLIKTALTLIERHQQLRFDEKPLPLGEVWKPLSLVINKTWRKLM